MTLATRALIRKTVLSLACLAIGVIYLFPYIWMVMTGFRSAVDTLSMRVLFTPTLAGFHGVLGDSGFQAHILNSIIVALTTTGAVLAIAVPAGYALAHLPIRGGSFLIAVLVARMVPGIAILIPIYLAASRLGVLDTHCIPVSATEGDNVVTRSPRTPWYDGPTVLGYLETVDDTRLAVGSELRFPVQSVVRPQSAAPAPWASRAPSIDGDYRGYAGKVESGRVSVGEEIVILPRTAHATVEAIDTPDGPLETAVAGQSVVIRLNSDIDVSRGDILAATDAPPAPVREVTATVCWLAERELSVGARVLVQHGTALTKAIVRSIEGTLDLDFEVGEVPRWQPAASLALNDIGRVRLALASPLPIDSYREHRTTGAFIIVDEADGWTLGAGMAGSTPLRTTSVDPTRNGVHSPAQPGTDLP